jgi:hypothetical protein
MDPVRPQHHYMTTGTAVLMFTALHLAARSERPGRRRQDPDARCMRQMRMFLPCLDLGFAGKRSIGADLRSSGNSYGACGGHPDILLPAQAEQMQDASKIFSLHKP